MQHRKCIAAGLMGLALITGLIACGGNGLSKRQLGEIARLTNRVRAVCQRDAPLVGSEAAPALRMVQRLMQLVRRSPNQRWVVDPEDHDTGTTTPAEQMHYVSEIFGFATNRGDPLCSPYLAGRVDQFLAELD
jgi:hypothetical protein